MSQQILLVYQVTEGLGDSIRINQIRNFLKASGFGVQEAPLPDVTLSSIRKSKALRDEALTIKGIQEFIRYKPRNPLIKRRYLFIRKYIARILKKTHIDIILAETSFVGWLVLQALDEISLPVIVDVHGLYGAEAIGRGDRSWNQRESLEKEVFKWSNHLLVVTNAMKDHITQKFNISAEKISVIANGSTSKGTRAAFNHPLHVIFAGLFAYWEKIDDYLDLAKAADSKDFKFYLAGDGVLKSYILGRIKQEQIPITYLGLIPLNEIDQILSKMQIGIAPSTKDVVREVAWPIKVLDYMSHGLPVIVPKIGDWGQMIETKQCGIALREDSLENYLQALAALKMKDAWNIMSLNGVRAIKEQYNWTNLLKPLKTIITT